MPSPAELNPNAPAERWERFRAASVRAFHRYASWLVSISWKRFIVLSLLLLVIAGIMTDLPPFKWSFTETIEGSPIAELAAPPAPPAAPVAPPARQPRPAAEAASAASAPDRISIQIDDKGIVIAPTAAEPHARVDDKGISIALPAGVDKQAVRDALQRAARAIGKPQEGAAAPAPAAPSADDGDDETAADATGSARDEARSAHAQEQSARETARAALDRARAELGGPSRIKRTRQLRWGQSLPQFALLWIFASAILKGTYKGRIQAEVKAAQATETAEAESLRRQVLEARMAAMQAQVEPHFLFNTLASIDHLIEVDPARASQMQKNLIALLRASMPTMREASDGGVRDLGREIAVIRPYLEILKVRMEERLTTEIAVPEGLMSAEFPPMMIQTLVENAIKHGLEPKPEGGSIAVRAEIVHGKLAVSVADTGLGFGRAATAGTGVGLANIRERLQLLYGSKASLSVAENQPTGTVVTVTVPYKTIEGAHA